MAVEIVGGLPREHLPHTSIDRVFRQLGQGVERVGVDEKAARVAQQSSVNCSCGSGLRQGLGLNLVEFG